MMRFKYLPHALQVMCATLVLAPVGAMAAVGVNYTSSMLLPQWYLGYLAAVYVIIPWVLAALVVKRHAGFLFLFGLEACLLIAHNVLGSSYVDIPLYLRFTHYAFAMITSALALMMINRDLLFPFIFEKYRGFRRAPRVELNQRVEVAMPRIDKKFMGMVEDASLTGLSIYGFEEAMSDILSFAQRGEPLVVTYRNPKQALQVQGWFLWSAQTSAVVKIGFRASDTPSMEKFFEVLGLDAQAPNWRWKWRQSWGRKGFRRVLNYGLAAAILAVLMVPLVDREVAPPAPVAPVVPERPVKQSAKFKLRAPPKLKRAH